MRTRKSAAHFETDIGRTGLRSHRRASDTATLFVTMSWRETFCLPALEAMTRGVPVVASRWGALPEIVGEQGSLIDPRDHARAASTILALLEHDNAAAAAAARFDWSTTWTQTLDVYRRVLGA